MCIKYFKDVSDDILECRFEKIIFYPQSVGSKKGDISINPELYSVLEYRRVPYSLGLTEWHWVILITPKITETFKKKVNFFNLVVTVFFSKIYILKPPMLLKYSSKASFNDKILCHISQ
jgi:hypothetical protein